MFQVSTGRKEPGERRRNSAGLDLKPGGKQEEEKRRKKKNTQGNHEQLVDRCAAACIAPLLFLFWNQNEESSPRQAYAARNAGGETSQFCSAQIVVGVI